MCCPGRVPSVEALGHGSTADLISQAQQKATSSAHSVLSAAALAADSAAHASSSIQYLDAATILEDARSCLSKAPLLAELHECTSWQLLFEAHLGSLFDFVEQQGGPFLTVNSTAGHRVVGSSFRIIQD